MTDVSRNVVAILLVLVIAASAFGTWSVLTSSSDIRQPVGQAPGPAGNPNAAVDVTIGPAPVTGGVIGLDVVGGPRG